MALRWHARKGNAPVFELQSRPLIQPGSVMQQLTLIRPDDWHLHLRDGALMQSVVQDTARQFARAIVMPNLRPPVTTTANPLQAPWEITAGWRVSSTASQRCCAPLPVAAFRSRLR